jgi:hypothetical protein
MATPPTKRKRVEIPVSVKKKIFQHKIDHPQASLQDICQFSRDETSIAIGKTTIIKCILFDKSHRQFKLFFYCRYKDRTCIGMYVLKTHLYEISSCEND